MKKSIVLIGLLAAIVIAPNVNADPVIPAVISISPSSGEIEGGNVITINGAAFVEENTVTIDGITIADTFVSSSVLTVVAPPHNVGRVDIAVFAGISGAVLPNAYEYIDTPDPTPMPSASPSPTPTVSATPSPVSVVAPNVSSDPAPVAAPAPIVEPAPTPTPHGAIEIPIVEATPIVFSDTVSAISEDGMLDITVSNVTSPYKKFMLKRNEGGIWKNTKIGYRTNDIIIFHDVVNRIAKYIVVPYYHQEILVRKFRIYG